MKLAIAYSTKDQVELSEQTLPRIWPTKHGDILWCDGSVTKEGRDFPEKFYQIPTRVIGGADAAIAWKLSKTLASPENYTHIGLLENDVLLDPDWFEPTMELFEKGKRDGLEVGAVSPRSYVDRILIQRDGYAVMHNIGAGAIIFTREAAEIVLRTFRTGWWPDVVKLFAQVSGIDVRTYACFRGNEQHVTTDWQFEAQLARHGLASLALTPARCQMVGQNPPLAQQGLELTSADSQKIRSPEDSFDRYRGNLDRLRADHHYELPGMIHREGASMLIFPHQLGAINSIRDDKWKLKWTQALGPFSYIAGPGGASLSARVSGSCSFLASGGAAGAKVTIEDHRSGFKFAPELPPGTETISINVPGGPVPRLISGDFGEGAVFHGLSCLEPQMIDTTFRFNWEQLPEV